MARPISDEELQLKKRARRRLIGAIALVTVVVVALPMVLDSEPRPISQDVEIRIPSPDSGTFTSKVVPVAPSPESGTPPKPPAAAAVKAEPTRAVESKVPQARSPVPAVPAPQPGASVAKDATKTGQVPEAARAAASPPASEAIPSKFAEVPAGKFVVQVVALADAEKAKQKRAEIAAAGLPSYTEVVKTVKGDVTRVRAGPFATREAAEKASEQLKTLGMNGNITTK